MIKNHCDNCDAVIEPSMMVSNLSATRVVQRVDTASGLNVEAWLVVIPAGKDALCRECYTEIANKYVAALNR